MKRNVRHVISVDAESWQALWNDEWEGFVYCKARTGRKDTLDVNYHSLFFTSSNTWWSILTRYFVAPLQVHPIAPRDEDSL